MKLANSCNRGNPFKAFEKKRIDLSKIEAEFGFGLKGSLWLQHPVLEVIEAVD